MGGPARGRAWASPAAEAAVLAAEATPVPPLLPSAAQTWLRPSQPRQLPSLPPPKPPQQWAGTRRGLCRLTHGENWFLAFGAAREGSTKSLVEGPGLTLAARWPGVGVVLWPVQGVTSGPPSPPNSHISGASWVSACSASFRGQ